MGIVPNGLLALCGALCAECYKQFLIALAKVVILLRTSRSMDLCERIMGVEHELPGALLGSARFFLGAMASTPLFPHNREGHNMAGQTVLTPPAPPRPHWCETRPPFPLEVPVPSVTTCAVMMGRGPLWCVGNEDFRQQQQPDHASRMLQRGATYLGGIEHASVYEVHIGLGRRVIPDHVGGGLDPLHHRRPLNPSVQRDLPHGLFERPFDNGDTDLAVPLELQPLQGG